MKTKKTTLILFTLSFLILFTIARPVKAIFSAIFEYQGVVLDALDFLELTILRLLLFLIILAFGSAAFLILSGSFLKWTYHLPLHLKNELVLGGWHFVLGLVNLFFILVFVFIALTYILKIETLQIKKALPRLIAIVLLVNFSMLIVGLFVDISQFFMNSFKDAFGSTSYEKLDFVDKAILPMKKNIGGIILPLLAYVGTYIGTAFLPFGPLIFLGVIVSLLRKYLFNYIFSALILTGINFLTGIMFFVFGILFIVRIAALWLLTIFAPLAFFAFIFPQTKKYFEMWFKMVIQWAFLGVVAFFLLGFITSLFSKVVDTVSINISGISGVEPFELPPSSYSYFFYVVFLAVALYATTKYVPTGADRIVSVAKGFTQSFIKPYGISLSKTLSGKFHERVIRRIKPISPKKEETQKRWAVVRPKTFKEIQEETKKSEKRFPRIRYVAHRLKTWGQRTLGLYALQKAIETDRRFFEKAYNKAIKEKNPYKNLHNLRSRFLTPVEKAGIITAMAELSQVKTARDEKKVGKEGVITDEEIGNAFKIACRLEDKDAISALKTSFSDKYKMLGAIEEGVLTSKEKEERNKTIEEILKKLRELRDGKVITQKEYGNIRDMLTNEENIKGLTREDILRGYTSYLDKIVDSLKTKDDIKLLPKKIFKDEGFMEAVHKFWGGPEVKAAADIFSRTFIDRFEETKKDLNFYTKINPITGRPQNLSLAIFALTTTAAAVGITPTKGGETIRKVMEKIREVEKKRKITKNTRKLSKGGKNK